MDSKDEFIRRVMSFGLTEKEAECYSSLLKHGPKTPSPLAKSLHTYREDVHRTLNSLIDKGMVRASLDAPTVYVAVDLDTALGFALKKQETELREMEARKRELQELAKQQQFPASDEVAKFKILKNIKEVVDTALPLFLSAENEFLWVVNTAGVEFGEKFGTVEAEKEFIGRGGRCRGITDISYRLIDPIRHSLDIGVEVRHFDGYSGIYYGVFDKKHCISAINIDVQHLRLSEPLSMLYTDDPAYAGYLITTFEILWGQSVPAEERIHELLKQGPPQAND